MNRLRYSGGMRAFITVVVVLGLTATASADRKKAMQLNAQGMKKYAKKDPQGAAKLFEKAIKEDETLAYAHYNLASMASLNHEFLVTIRELEWCKKSTDPVAAKLMAKAKTDKDLEDALMHPRVRELAGLPALETIPIDQVLLERSGIWGEEQSACAGASATFWFKKGTFTVKAQAGCNEYNEEFKTSGTWSVKDGKLVLVPKKKNKVFEGATLTGTIGDCYPGKGEEYSEHGKCIKLDDDGSDRTLWRGDHSY